MRHGRGYECGGGQLVVADGVVNASACCLQRRHDGVEGFFGWLKKEMNARAQMPNFEYRVLSNICYSASEQLKRAERSCSKLMR